MITAAPLPLQPSPPRPAPARWQQAWREAWREAVRDPRELLRMLDLDAAAANLSEQAAARFALRVPRGFVARMRRGDLHDPLLRQVLPVGEEMQIGRAHV